MSDVDIKTLLDATAVAIDMCETRLRVVLPYLETRCGECEVSDIRQTVRMLQSLRKKFPLSKKEK
jgi:hypothetical protein